MGEGLATPVVFLLFNRPEPTAQVFAAIRRARPQTLLVVADGPRADHPEDQARCEQARAVLDQVDWPCDVLWEAADENLGCDPRVQSGLDWAFEQVEEAIVLEDDMVPHDSLFPWAAAMLDRYRDDPEVVHVSGRNELGWWGPPGADHLISQRGNIWGWATWRDAWQRADRHLAAVHDPDLVARLLASYADPIVAKPVAMEVGWAQAGELGAWDHRWCLACAFSGGVQVMPPVNLVVNVGFGAHATRTTNAADLRGTMPSFPAPPLRPFDGTRPPVDATFDLWCVLVDIMTTYLDPAMVHRLARSRRLFADPRLAQAASAAFHLTPFDVPDVSLQVVHHLQAVGVHSTMLDALAPELEAAAAAVAATSADPARPG